MTHQPLRLQVTTAPVNLPVTLDEAKTQANIDDDFTDDDALILGYVRTATDDVENNTGRALITRTYTLFLDDWPKGAGKDTIWEGWREGAETTLLSPVRALDLPRPPLIAVTSISTFDDSDVETTYAATNYFVDNVTQPGRVVLRKSAAAPNPDRVASGVKMVFTAGYGPSFTDVSQGLRDAILQEVAFLYENRGDCAPEKALHASGAAALLGPYRILKV